MGSTFLLILLLAFSPVIAFMCWCELRDWQPSYMRQKPLPPSPSEANGQATASASRTLAMSEVRSR
jgi:hypothetical protein